MVSNKTIAMWEANLKLKNEKKKEVIKFIDFLMEEYDISIVELE